MKVNVIVVSVLAALCALALKADSYSADVSTPETDRFLASECAREDLDFFRSHLG